jgi:site-specific recombinase XerD
MFEQLFSKPSAVIHHRAAPYATERERFLDECARRGYSRSRLKRFAAELLVAAHELHSHGGLPTSPDDLESAADRVAKLWSTEDKHGGAYRESFLRAAKQWLTSIGQLRIPVQRPRSYSSLLDDFAQSLAEERGLSDRTIMNRRWNVARFLAWLYERHGRLADLKLRDIDAFLQAMRDKGVSTVSIKCHTDGIRAFLRHAERKKWCAAGLANMLAGPRLYRERGLPLGPSWEEVKKLVENASSNRPVDIRDRAILLLFSVYGLRGGEVAALRLDDIDWEHDRITVPRPKQRRSQLYPLVPEVGAAIVRYLKEARPRCAARELFLKLKAPIGPTTSTSLYHVVANRLKRLGIRTPHRGPHALRHACAGRLVAKGMPIKAIADHLGHSSLDSARIYAKVDFGGLREVAAFDLGEVA